MALTCCPGYCLHAGVRGQGTLLGRQWHPGNQEHTEEGGCNQFCNKRPMWWPLYCVAGEFCTSRVQWGERGGSGLHQKYETTSVTASVKLCCFKPSLDLSAFLESDTLPGFDDSVLFQDCWKSSRADEWLETSASDTRGSNRSSLIHLIFKSGIGNNFFLVRTKYKYDLETTSKLELWILNGWSEKGGFHFGYQPFGSGDVLNPGSGGPAWSHNNGLQNISFKCV